MARQCHAHSNVIVIRSAARRVAPRSGPTHLPGSARKPDGPTRRLVLVFCGPRIGVPPGVAACSALRYAADDSHARTDYKGVVSDMHVKVLYIICVPNSNDHQHEIERGGEALYHKYTASDRRAADARPEMVALWHVTPRMGGAPLSVVCIKRSKFVDSQHEENIGVYLFAHGARGKPMDFNAKDLVVIFDEIGIARMRKLSLVGCSLGQKPCVDANKTEAARNFLEKACAVLAEKKPTPKIAGISDFVTLVPADRRDDEPIGDKKEDLREEERQICVGQSCRPSRTQGDPQCRWPAGPGERQARPARREARQGTTEAGLSESGRTGRPAHVGRLVRQARLKAQDRCDDGAFDVRERLSSIRTATTRPQRFGLTISVDAGCSDCTDKWVALPAISARPRRPLRGARYSERQ